jgi:hypothetical protein
MGAELDHARLDHATAVVKYRTAQLELRARKIQLLIAFVTFATTILVVLGAFFVGAKI